MPREADLSEEQSRLILDDYVMPGDCETASFPGQLKRSIVSKYVEEKLGADHASTIFHRLIKLARFYVLNGSADALATRIPNRCKDEDELEDALLAIGACAELGGATRKDQAVEAYDRLVGTPATEQVRTARGLCAAFFGLPRSAKPDKLREHINRKRVQVERNGPSVDFAEWNHCDLRLIPRVLEAKKSKDSIVDLYPQLTLALLHAVLPDNVAAWPYRIEATLHRIGEADQSLRLDERLIELNRKWNAR